MNAITEEKHKKYSSKSKAFDWLSLLHMLNSDGTPGSVEYWEILVHGRGEQIKLYLGLKAWEKAWELCREPGSQLCSATLQLMRGTRPWTC